MSSASFHDLLELLRRNVELTPGQVEFAAGFLLDENADAALKADFLRALAAKGETDAEIAAFVTAFLDRAVDPGLDPAALHGPVIDVCGTGGDRLDLFNVSTTGMFILAAGGAVVVKHGNRSVSSQCGGADVLEALGIAIDLGPEAFRRRVESAGLGFLFAPLYHPAFKVVAPIRKALAAEGVTTIFNLLGPLLNPARPDYQLVGVFSEAVLPKYAATLRRLGRKRAWAVHGRSGFSPEARGMDEVSTLGPTLIHAVNHAANHSANAGEISECLIAAEQLASLGFGPPGSVSLDDLRGGTRQENAAILLGILDGSLRGPKRDLALLNSACGFVVSGLAASLEEGMDRAKEQVDSGRALKKLRLLQG